MEKICNNCKHWQPNGSPLGVGYCRASDWVYRKPEQSCKNKFEPAKVYVSGPITGRLIEARRQFAEAKVHLTDAGFDVFNPLENGLGVDEPWERHLAVDVLELLACQAILPLPGWEQSQGARLEMEVAKLVGLRIFAWQTEEPEV